MLGLLLSVVFAALAIAPGEDAEIERAARTHRIHVYHALRTDRPEYDRHRMQGEQKLKAWIAEGRPAEKREELVRWFEQAIEQLPQPPDMSPWSLVNGGAPMTHGFRGCVCSESPLPYLVRQPIAPEAELAREPASTEPPEFGFGLTPVKPPDVPPVPATADKLALPQTPQRPTIEPAEMEDLAAAPEEPDETYPTTDDLDIGPGDLEVGTFDVQMESALKLQRALGKLRQDFQPGDPRWNNVRLFAKFVRITGLGGQLPWVVSGALRGLEKF